MKQIHQRSVAVVILAVAITITGAGITAAPVAADHDCSNVNKATWFAFSGASLIGEATDGSGVGCDMWHEETAVQEIRESEQNQTEVDLYSAISGQKSQADAGNKVTQNYLQDTESIAWQKAEAAIAEAYENGSSKAEAKVAAKEAIRDYYTLKQHNLNERSNALLYAGEAVDERASQEGISDSYVRVAPESCCNSYDGSGVEGTSFSNVTIQLINGTQTEAVEFHIPSSYSYNIETGSTSSGGPQYLMVPGPNQDHDTLYFYSTSEYRQMWTDIENQSSSLTNESDAFVDATWQDYQDGNIDSSDVISRTTLMFEYGTATSNGSGNFYDMIGAAAGMGLDTPNLNKTGTMTITIPDAGNTYEGMVFARNVPNNTWEVGKTYNPDNITGPVLLASTAGDFFQVERNFTIDSATDTQGNDVQTVDTTNYNYRTANTSDLQAKYDELLRLTQEIENRQDELYESGGGGGGSLGGYDPINVVAIVVAAGALIYAMGGRNSNGR